MSAGDMVDPPAFPNGTSHRMWEGLYCQTCWHDSEFRDGSSDVGCRLIALGFVHEPVEQWVETDEYPNAVSGVHCTRYTPDTNATLQQIETIGDACPEQANCNHEREEL